MASRYSRQGMDKEGTAAGAGGVWDTGMFQAGAQQIITGWWFGTFFIFPYIDYI
jgi:hypothetical protein